MVRSYNQIKQRRKGFTIVELLIVIVVIAILATITIVAYGGITARANAAKAQTNAANAQKVAEAYNADNGSYPITTAALIAGSTSTKIPSGLTVVPSTGISPASTWAGGSGNPAVGLSTVTYSCTAAATTGPCDGDGGRIGWWNFGLPTPAVNYVYVGSASLGSVFFYNT